MDRATTAVLGRLRRGPASTVELQAELYATHVPKQIFDLRQADYNIATIRLRNGTALYQLVSEPGVTQRILDRARGAQAEVDKVTGAPVGAGLEAQPRTTGTRITSPATAMEIPPAPSRAPVFGDVATIREMRPKGRR